MSYETIMSEICGNVGVIQLNRPRSLNALNSQLAAELGRAIDDNEQNPLIRCMLLTGSERAFAAGADIVELAGKTSVEAIEQDLTASWNHVARARETGCCSRGRVCVGRRLRNSQCSATL